MKLNLLPLLSIFLLLANLQAEETSLVFSAKFNEKSFRGKAYKEGPLRGLLSTKDNYDKASKSLRIHDKNFLKFPKFNISKLPTNKFTVMTWVKHDDDKTGNIVGCFHQENRKNAGWYLGNRGENLRIGFGNYNEKKFMIYSFKKMEKFKLWRHVAFTYDNKKVRVYINGRLVKKLEGIGPLKYKRNKTKLALGSYLQKKENIRMNGLINKVEIHNRVFSSKEIYRDYKSSSLRKDSYTPLFTHSSWNFEKKFLKGNMIKGSAKKHSAQLPNAGSLTKHKSVKLKKSQAIIIKNATGKSLPFEEISLSAWVKIDLQSKAGIISTLDPSRKTGWSLFTSQAMKLNFHAYLQNKAQLKLEAPQALEPGKWYHVALHYNGRVAKLYINGKVAYRMKKSGLLHYGEKDKLVLGSVMNKDKTSSSLHGELASVTVSEKNYSKYFAKNFKKSKRYFQKHNTIVKKKEITLEQGAYYSYFDKKSSAINDYLTMKPQNTGKHETFTIPSQFNKDNFGIEFFAYIKIDEYNDYILSVEADDNAVIYLADKQIAQKGKESELVGLEKGYHPITILYKEITKAQTLKVFIKKSSGEKRELSKEDLYIVPGFSRYPHKHSISSNLKARSDKNKLENAIDKKDETFFWVSQTLRKNDHVTLTLPAPMPLSQISCLLGTETTDYVKNASLQVSSNGKSFTDISHFTGTKTLNIKLNKQVVKVIRIKFNGPASRWMAIKEIKYFSPILKKIELK